MRQTTRSGQAARERGLRRGRTMGRELGLTDMESGANIGKWRGQPTLIKTASRTNRGINCTRTSLRRVTSLLGGFETRAQVYTIYEMPAAVALRSPGGRRQIR